MGHVLNDGSRWTQPLDAQYMIEIWYTKRLEKDMIW